MKVLFRNFDSCRLVISLVKSKRPSGLDKGLHLKYMHDATTLQSSRGTTVGSRCTCSPQGSDPDRQLMYFRTFINLEDYWLISVYFRTWLRSNG